jgi:hypothetical protein
MAMNGSEFEGAVLINPVAAYDFTREERDGFIAWWRQTAFPAIKAELGTVKWTTSAREWTLILIDQESGINLMVMRPAAVPGDKPFYLEPDEDVIPKIVAVIKAARDFHVMARGRSTVPDDEPVN